MSVMCGNCKEHHENAAAVAACYGRKIGRDAAAFQRRVDETFANYATSKQKNFINKLRTERGVEEPQSPVATMTKREASAEITRLMAMPRLNKFDPDLPKVTPGRYALRVEDDTDPENTLVHTVIKFFRVRIPDDGRFKGLTFVDVQASDDFYPVKPLSARREVLRRIAEDPEAAMTLYGRELGACGHCGRTLTNEESRARGIGPICARKMGW